MKTVIVEMVGPTGKLIRTFRESFYGPVLGGRDAMKAAALATISKRLLPLYPKNTFRVRNSNI